MNVGVPPYVLDAIVFIIVAVNAHANYEDAQPRIDKDSRRYLEEVLVSTHGFERKMLRFVLSRC